ncbi:MAG: hypothetical protein F6K31_03730 [Symploca sp. SIO2G7]|nr:hypothetical protein [Symploca sp. SIO2G7]
MTFSLFKKPNLELVEQASSLSLMELMMTAFCAIANALDAQFPSRNRVFNFTVTH